tara:strand:+ start:4539 stop:4643 length:105 start_codon:yes stop_codon:yes gene_type:complete
MGDGQRHETVACRPFEMNAAIAKCLTDIGAGVPE